MAIRKKITSARNPSAWKGNDGSDVKFVFDVNSERNRFVYLMHEIGKC
jgi:hypothetical protein